MNGVSTQTTNNNNNNSSINSVEALAGMVGQVEAVPRFQQEDIPAIPNVNAEQEGEENQQTDSTDNGFSPQIQPASQLEDRRAKEAFNKQSEQYDTGSKKDKSNTNYNSDDRNISWRERRRRQQQARSTSYINQQAALEKFRKQAEQFDKGRDKFREQLKPTNQELVDYVKQDLKSNSKKAQKDKLHATAGQILRREREAEAAVKAQRNKVRDGQHGEISIDRPNDVLRIIFENWNSLGLGRGKRKVNEINGILKRYNADILLGCESQYDWRLVDEELQFKNLFGQGEDTRSVAANNITEDENVREQYGGTAAMAIGRIAGHVIDTGSDTTKLGRWAWLLLGLGDVKTRVVVAYNPTQPNLKTSRGGTVFEQHARYFKKRDIKTSPRTLFMEHLVSQIKKWKDAGEEILLFGDFNENVYTGRISKRLAQDDINMQEQYRIANGKPLPPTHVRSTSAAVCGVFATAGAEVLSACILPKYAGAGDHRCFVLDFASHSVLGTKFPKIVRTAARKLHCKSTRIRDNYVSVLNQLTDRHRMFHKLNQLSKLQGHVSASQFQLEFNKWDEELTQLMLAAENKCNTHKSCHIPYSPEVATWISRRWILGRCKRYKLGKVPDPRNLFRQCGVYGVTDPRELTMEELNIEIYLCCKKIEELRPKAPKMRVDHLKACLKRARENSDEVRSAAIKRVLEREANKARWSRCHRTTKKSKGRAVTEVKVPAPTEEDPNAYKKYDTADGIFDAMSENLCTRFRLAFTAPSYSGKLFDDIGFLGDTKAARQILEGTYEFDPDEDPGTRLLLEEAAHTYAAMSDQEVATYVTVEDFQYYWKRVNERISSSYSGLHFSHYKAAAEDDGLSGLHAKKLTMVARSGVPLNRWGVGVTVLLEKICGNNYVHKLRAICLLEADFNWWNKLVFARRMMKLARDKGVIPPENRAQAGSHVNQALMMKNWFADVSKVLHWPAAIGGCDFSDCYDRAAHGPASIGLQAWGVPTLAVTVLLKAMQIMQFSVRTGFGESTRFYGGSEEDPFGGFGQGNGAAPPGFASLSALVVNAYKRMGNNGAKLTSCYTSRLFLLAAVMYVDDTDLCHMTPSQTATDEELISRVQESTDAWTQLGQATGGAMKPPKCLTYFMSYKFVNGAARLKKPHELPPAKYQVDMGNDVILPSHITVPQPDGTNVPIPTLDVKTPSEMLGFWFAPIGNGSSHIDEMKKKGFNWVDCNKTRPLPPRDAWLSFHLQLMPGMTWGLLAVCMPPEKLDASIHSLYHKILPHLRVNRNITKGWRTLSNRYQGLGMPNFVVLCFAEQVFFLQCFWGFDEHPVGNMLLQAFEAFQMEVGLGGDIFTRDFDKLGVLATDGTWFKNFWNYSHHLSISFCIHEDYHLKPHRSGDIPIMELLLTRDVSQDTLVRFNRVRKFNKITHVSEAVYCDGRTVDARICNRDVKPRGQVLYSLEKPTPSDFRLWNDVIKELTSPSLRLQIGLGPYFRSVDKHWYISEDSSQVYRVQVLEDGRKAFQVYECQSRRHNTRYGALFKLMRTEMGSPISTSFASVLEVDEFHVRLHSQASVPRPISKPTAFWDVLKSFSNQSLWRHFHCEGDGFWITQALIAGTLMCVHDGSFMVCMDKTVCSAGFIIRCTKSGKTAMGSVVEKSDVASNYRGEILGGMMIQLVLRAASSVSRPYRQVVVNCDNMGVVNHGNEPQAPLQEKQSQADVLRCLKQYVKENRFETVYEWVKAHQDDRMRWDDLNLKEQLNCIVDALAKKALICSLVNRQFISNLFPFEQVRVIMGKKKLTASPKKSFVEYVDYKTARDLYDARGIIPKRYFYLVYWDGVYKLNTILPKMFGVWLTKHTSHFCATNRHANRIDKRVANICPSCGKEDETVAHIVRCKDSGRLEMLRVSVQELVDWLDKMDTDEDLIEMIQEYLLAQGEKRMVDCSPPRRYQLLAKTHDYLGYDNFVEGRICSLFLEVYRQDLDENESPYKVDKWAKGFIERLVRITHSQWVFRNSHVHFKKAEGLTEAQHMEIFRRVEELMWEDPMSLLPSDRHLLEEDIDILGTCSTAVRKYWIMEVEAAQVSATRVMSGIPTRDRYKAFIPRQSGRREVVVQKRNNGGIVYKRSWKQSSSLRNSSSRIG